MDREAFRARLARYKQAKYGNPDLKYYDFMEKLAEFKAREWHDNPDAVYAHMLNDNTYNYRQMYEDNPDFNITEGHFVDTYKTVYHPTFSNESMYSGKKSQYNPDGKVGGVWDEYNRQFIVGKDWDLKRTQDYLNHADPGYKVVPRYNTGTSSVGEDDNRVTYEGYDSKGERWIGTNSTMNMPEVVITPGKSFAERALQKMHHMLDNDVTYNDYGAAADSKWYQDALLKITHGRYYPNRLPRMGSNCTLNATYAYDDPLMTARSVIRNKDKWKQISASQAIPGDLVIQSLPDMNDGPQDSYHTMLFDGISDSTYVNKFGDHVNKGDTMFIYSNGLPTSGAMRVRPKSATDTNNGKTRYRYYRYVPQKKADGGVVEDDTSDSIDYSKMSTDDFKRLLESQTTGEITPEQEQRLWADQEKYARMSGRIDPVFNLWDTPLGFAKDVVDAADEVAHGNPAGAALTIFLGKKAADKKPLTGLEKRQLQSEWNNLRNRSIERLYDPEIAERAKLVQQKYGADLQPTYDDILHRYETNYGSLPQINITELNGARARTGLTEEARRRYEQEGIVPAYEDYVINIDPNTTPSQSVMNHEMGHITKYKAMGAPTPEGTMLDAMNKQYQNIVRKVNPIAPGRSKAFKDVLEGLQYGEDFVNRMKQAGLKLTRKNVEAFLEIMSNEDPTKQAIMQLYPSARLKWLNSLPLAQNKDTNKEQETYYA